MKSIFIFLFVITFGQSYSKTFYFKASGEIVSNIEKAVLYIDFVEKKNKFVLKEYSIENSKISKLNYYEKVKRINDTALIIKTFYKNNLPVTTIRSYKAINDSIFLVTDYYKNGIRKCVGYSHGYYPLIKEGQYTYYYENGQLRSNDYYKKNKLIRNQLWLQDGTKSVSNVFEWADKLPNYHGSIDNFRDYVQNNLQYPSSALIRHIEGIVNVEFIVMETGELMGIQVIGNNNKYLDSEALRVIRSTPDLWNPGLIDNEKVRVKFTIPVIFEIKK